MFRFPRAAVWVAGAILLTGCASRTPQASRLETVPPDVPHAAGDLSEYMAKVRHLSATRKPAPRPGLPTLETADAEVAAALTAVRARPTAAAHRLLGERYRERGVLDMAYSHFNQAVALDRRDSAAHEGLARVWRDWRLPELAIGDAHRAVFHAPASASARNTFGTVMQALGQFDEAQRAFELAAQLDPNGAYAVNNLCYLSFVRGRIDAAIDLCAAALELDPAMPAARNNLALAFAAAGRIDLARTHFLDAGDEASGLYNTGIVYLATGNETAALDAFDAATRLRPAFHLAHARARLIRERKHKATIAARLAGQ